MLDEFWRLRLKSKNNELLGLVSVVLIWYITSFFVGSSCVPSPHNTLIILADSFRREHILIHILYSLYRIVLSLTLAVVIGVIIGILLGLNNKLDYVLSPSIYMIFPIPKAALLPAIFAIFGLGDKSKIFIIFLIVVFQVIISVRDSVKSIPEESFISGMSIGMDRRDILFHIVIPSILPSLLSVARITVGIGLAVLFFSEAYATRYGIGYYILNKWSLIEYEKMYGGIVILSFMGYCMFKLIDVIEVKFCRWSR